MRNLYNLSIAEKQVMEMIIKGYSLNYIADKMCISYTTLSTHLIHVYQKYGINNNKTYNQRARATYLYMREEADNE